MPRTLAIACLAIVFVATATAKPRKPPVPPAFQDAHNVYVESADGDPSKPGVSTADRLAVAQVQLFLREWNRYTLVTQRQKADLIIVVRKGRAAEDDLDQRLHSPSPQSGAVPPGQTPRPTLPSAVDGSVSSPTDQFASPDRLRVYTLNEQGKQQGPIWGRELNGGLDGPAVRLMQELKEAVELAYPGASATPSAP